MDESNFYRDMSEEGRRILEETSKKLGEPMEQDDDARQARRMDRRRRRAQRRDRSCRCGRSRSRRRRRSRKIRSRNPFIIFYLEMYYKSPGQRVTEVARQAGKEWCGMSQQDREKYVRLAEKERTRRGTRTRRRRGCEARKELGR